MPITGTPSKRPGRSGTGSIKVTTRPVRLDGIFRARGNGPAPIERQSRPRGGPTTTAPRSGGA